jgi:NAD(P)-dependent dehydrogenase (short-subunit alcohol dehydrogenase family)
MPDLKGTILLTGANGGLGSATVSHIVSSPELKTSYYGLYTVRDAATAHTLDAALVDRSSRCSPQQDNAVPHSHEKISLDFTRLSNVRAVAAAINSRVAAGIIPRTHAIVLNAGYEEFETQTWTEDGLETTFAKNYLGHWLLTMLLLQSMDREVGRVVWISSWSHKSVGLRSDPSSQVSSW